MKTLIFLSKNIFNNIIFYLCFMFWLSACNSQAQKNEQYLSEANNKIIKHDDSSNKPKISYKVNKQLDKNGNIVKYDSTYSYVYRGGEGKGFSNLNTDSIFNSFNTQPFKLFDKQNNSFLNSDFFSDEKFFEKQMQFNNSLFDDFFKNVDSTNLLYLKKAPSNNFRKI